MRKVVDSQQGASVGEHAKGAEIGSEIHGDQRGVPIVGYKHDILAINALAFAINQERRLEPCLGQKAVAELVGIERQDKTDEPGCRTE